MELKAHFFDIHKVIVKHLLNAQSEILVAVAWFTDRDIFRDLCKKASAGVKVSVVLVGDDINKGPGGLNFDKLVDLGGQVTYLPAGSREVPIMHHKFCVIDRSTVITGSYNWSHKARSNDENITVVTDSQDFAGKYLETFNNLLVRSGKGAPVTIDTDAARRRLDMIRSLILLGEQEDIEPHLRKLRPLASELKLSRIIATLDKGGFKAALEQIDDYMRRDTAVVVAGFTEIFTLRFLLESLELRLESLSDEKAEMERRLINFNRRHDEALGDLIQQVLKARAELARRIAEAEQSGKTGEEAKAAAKEARSAYEDYSRQHEELQRAAPLPKLDERVERELKSLYRKACSLCHPDKAPEEKKSAAHQTFTELQEAYKSNDLERVREIFETLTSGDTISTRSKSLNEVEALKSATAEVEQSIRRMIIELRILNDSNGNIMLNSAGSTEAEWDVFFRATTQFTGTGIRQGAHSS